MLNTCHEVITGYACVSLVHSDDQQLSQTARQLIMDEQNEVFVSSATYWELAIKISLKKYQLPRPFVPFLHDQLDLNDFDILPVSIEHAGLLTALPFHHRDPFDRMLIAQSLIENTPLVSIDDLLDRYGIQRLW